MYCFMLQCWTVYMDCMQGSCAQSGISVAVASQVDEAFMHVGSSVLANHWLQSWADSCSSSSTQYRQSTIHGK